MFDDCNTFFKGKPDGRVAASAAVAGAAPMGGAERPAAAARHALPAQYLHSRRMASRLVLRQPVKVPKFAAAGPHGWRVAGMAGGSSGTETEQIGVWRATKQ